MGMTVVAGEPGTHWRALADGAPVGELRVWNRPDGRRFLLFGGDVGATAAALTSAAAGHYGGTDLYTEVDGDDGAARAALEAAGFRRSRHDDRFRVAFGTALDALGDRPLPPGVVVHTADRVDAAGLAALDNLLRQDVPGSDGWDASVEWFREETFEAPNFDPAGYLVAAGEASGELIGIVRFWRNDGDTRLGFAGVRRDHRGRGLGAALLVRAMRAAREWGHADFRAENSPEAVEMRALLVRMGAVRTGVDVVLMRRA